MSLEHAQALLRLLDSPPTGALPADAQASSLLLLAPWAAPGRIATARYAFEHIPSLFQTLLTPSLPACPAGAARVHTRCSAVMNLCRAGAGSRGSCAGSTRRRARCRGPPCRAPGADKA